MSVEERLASLEKRVDELTSENKALRTQLGYDGKSNVTLVRPAGKEAKFALGGFLHVQSEFGGAPDVRFAGINDRVFMRRARLGTTATFAEDFSARLEVEFGANSISPRTGIAPAVTDAFVTWSKFPEANLRLGQMKVPFGFEQLMSDTKAPLIERSLANDRLTQGRQIGAQWLGEAANKRVSYAVGVFNGSGANTSGNDNQNWMYAARVGVVALDAKHGAQKLKWTLSADAFTNNEKATLIGRRTGWGLDSQLSYGSFDLQAEWLANKVQPFGGTKVSSGGWSVIGAYFFDPKWQGVIRFDTYDSNTAASATTTDSWMFGLNYLLKGDDIKLSVDYLYANPPAPGAHAGRLISRLQVVF